MYLSTSYQDTFHLQQQLHHFDMPVLGGDVERGAAQPVPLVESDVPMLQELLHDSLVALGRNSIHIVT